LSVTGIVVALEIEAKCLRAAERRVRSASRWHGRPSEPRAMLSRLDAGALLCVGGVGAAAADHAARVLVRAGATALMSCGAAGGLDSALACGSIVLPQEVLQLDDAGSIVRRYQADAGWHEHLARTLSGVNQLSSASLASATQAMAGPAQKSALFHSTQAAAVDLESAAIAAVASERGLPFAVLRVIVDGARDSVPKSVLRAYAAEADPAFGARARALLGAPFDWPGLLRLGRRWRVARRTLKDCARRLELLPTAAAAPAR